MPARPSGTVVAGSPGAACPQPYASVTAPGLSQSEDCLFLNIYVPKSTTATSGLPVYFWIHGGSLIAGSGALFDPSSLVAQNNIVVVTINYRLGALGWLVEPGLLATTANTFQNAGEGGNYGLMDQQFALQWVQRNIAAFGGDPTKVTIGGQSAGALSVMTNLASPTAASLFRGAVIESGAYLLHSMPTQTQYGAAGAAFETGLSCPPPSDAACLRSASLASIFNEQNTVFGSNGIYPDSGNKILPHDLQTAFSTGAFNKVPVLQGSNANEGTLFEPSFFEYSSTTATQQAGGPANYDLSNPNSICGGTPCTYAQEVTYFLKGLAISSSVDAPGFQSSIAGDYPVANYPDPYLSGNAPSADAALSQVFTDEIYACNASDSDQELSQSVTVYSYEFNDPNAPPPLLYSPAAVTPPNNVYGFPSASTHTAELQFLFDFKATLSADEQQLANVMKTYWGNFVKSGNPNTPAAVPTWTQYNGSGSYQKLAPGQGNQAPFSTFSNKHFCSTWEPVLLAE